MKETIRSRRTLKVLANEASPWPVPSSEFDAELLEMVDLAACAPYHYACDACHLQGEMNSPAPWRFYVLNGHACRSLLNKAPTGLPPLGKIGAMLAAAHGLVMVTWLPDPPAAGQDPKFQSYAPTLRNMEHIAAVAAATQNLLLAATSAGLNNYWSSGGVLRSETAFDWLGIPHHQVLLGAIFLFPSDTGDAAIKPGANRERKGARNTWMSWVQL